MNALCERKPTVFYARDQFLRSQVLHNFRFICVGSDYVHVMFNLYNTFGVILDHVGNISRSRLHIANVSHTRPTSLLSPQLARERRLCNGLRILERVFLKLAMTCEHT